MTVKIPFRDGFKDVMLNGTKTMTCRSKAYGKAEDTFEAFGTKFVIIEVKKMKLGIVAFDHYKDEGCKSSDEFIEIWNEIHPWKGFQAETMVFAHRFERVI